MKRSIAVAGILLAAGAGGVVAISNMAKTDSSPSIISGLEDLKSKQDIPNSAPRKTTVDDIPVPSEIGPWPKVVASELTHTFGRMQVGDENSHRFEIRNEGDADLKLKAGTTTCKCTQFDFDQSAEVSVKTAIVKPGESVILTMSWKAGESPDRAFRHGGDVFTNDPKSTLLKYTVEGAIEMPYEVLPDTWSVGNIFNEQSGKFKGAIGSRIYDHLEIESIHSPSGKVQVTTAPMSPEDKVRDSYASGVVLNLELASDIPPGLFKEVLEIKLSQRDEPIKVPVTARKHGAIRLQQMAGTTFDLEKMRVQLGAFPAAEGRGGKVLLIVDEKEMSEPLKITELESDPSFMTATLSPFGEPSGTVHRYLLDVAVPPNRPHVQRTNSNPGFLRLSTNHPSGEALKFEVLLYSN